MRLFRRRLFATKALIISAMFLVPVVTLGWSYLADKAAAIGFSAKERLGVRHAQAALPLLQAAQDLRLQAVLSAAAGTATPGLGACPGRAPGLAAAAGRGGGRAGPPRWARPAPMPHCRRPRPMPAGNLARPMPPWRGHTVLVDAVLALIGQATDGSNLTLDPDIDSYYVMDAALFRLPAMLEMAQRLRVTRCWPAWPTPPGRCSSGPRWKPPRCMPTMPTT